VVVGHRKLTVGSSGRRGCATMGAVTMVAGTVGLTEIMAALQQARPVFHSEADFQHAFAWAAHRLDESINVRLEVPQDDGERLDVLCFGDHGWTASS